MQPEPPATAATTAKATTSIVPTAATPAGKTAMTLAPPPPQSKFSTPVCAPRWSLRLNGLLEAPWVNDPPRITPALRGEIDDALTAIDAARAPCAPGDIHRLMGSYAVMFQNSRQSAAEARLQLKGYADLLGDMPAHALHAAFREAALRQRFFPAVAELNGYANFPISVEKWREQRLRAMAHRHDATQGKGDVH
jgi:hypothetical protein